MAAFVALGYNFSSLAPPQTANAEHPKTQPAETAKPTRSLRHSCRIPRWFSLAVKGILALGVAGLCITGILFVADFFEARKGHGGFIPHPPAYSVDGTGPGQRGPVVKAYHIGEYKHDRAVEPPEWYVERPEDCHWVNPQTKDRGMDPGIASKAKKVLAPDADAHSLGLALMVVIALYLVLTGLW